MRPIGGGFILWGGAPKEKPWEEGAFSATVSDPAAKVNHAWFRGGWWDALTMAWKDVAEGGVLRPRARHGGRPQPGRHAFCAVPTGARRIARPSRCGWPGLSGQTNLRIGKDPAWLGRRIRPASATYRPWYAGRFTDINGVSFYWRDHYEELRQKSAPVSAIASTTRPCRPR